MNDLVRSFVRLLDAFAQHISTAFEGNVFASRQAGGASQVDDFRGFQIDMLGCLGSEPRQGIMVEKQTTFAAITPKTYIFMVLGFLGGV